MYIYYYHHFLQRFRLVASKLGISPLLLIVWHGPHFAAEYEGIRSRTTFILITVTVTTIVINRAPSAGAGAEAQ